MSEITEIQKWLNLHQEEAAEIESLKRKLKSARVREEKVREKLVVILKSTDWAEPDYVHERIHEALALLEGG